MTVLVCSFGCDSSGREDDEALRVLRNEDLIDFTVFGGLYPVDENEANYVEILGTPGVDALVGVGDTRERFLGFASDDRIRAGGGIDWVLGGRGHDRIYGGRGQDFLFGERDDDDLFGDRGPDVLSGNEGEDMLEGGFGEDQLFGGLGLDLLDGGEAADVSFGGQGDDHLEAGPGDDFLFGGMGLDVYAYRRGDGNDVIADSDGVYVVQCEDVIVSKSAGTCRGSRLPPGSDLVVGFADGAQLCVVGAAARPDVVTCSEPPAARIRPEVGCVAETADGSLQAWFGYDHRGAMPQTIPVGPGNRIDGTNAAPTASFASGRVYKAFAVPLPPGGAASWTLTDPAGFTATVTADANTTHCTGLEFGDTSTLCNLHPDVAPGCPPGQVSTYGVCRDLSSTFTIAPHAGAIAFAGVSQAQGMCEMVREIANREPEALRGRNTLLAASTAVFYMGAPETRGPQFDFEFDPTRLLETLEASKATGIPLFFHMNGSRFQLSADDFFEDDGFAYQDGYCYHSAFDPGQRQLNQCDSPLVNWAIMPDARTPDGTPLPAPPDPAGNDLRGQYGAECYPAAFRGSRFRALKERNLRAAVRIIAQFAVDNPGLFAGIGGDSETHQYANYAYTGPAVGDYNPGSIVEFREWMRARYGNDIHRVNLRFGSSFPSFEAIDPPRDLRGFEQPDGTYTCQGVPPSGVYPDGATADPRVLEDYRRAYAGCDEPAQQAARAVAIPVERCRSWWHEWMRFREYNSYDLVDETTAIIVDEASKVPGAPAFINARTTWAHQALPPKASNPIANNVVAAPLHTGMPRSGSCGFSLYGPPIDDDETIAELGARCGTWAVLEFNANYLPNCGAEPVHPRCNSSQAVFLERLEALFTQGVRVVAPFAWHLGNYEGVTIEQRGLSRLSLANRFNGVAVLRPGGQALREWLQSNADRPWTPRPDGIPPGTILTDASGGTPIEGLFRVDVPGPGAVVGGPSMQVGGWLLDNQALERIEVSIDGGPPSLVGDTHAFRPDVDLALFGDLTWFDRSPFDPRPDGNLFQCFDCGFRGDIDISSVPGGPHTVTVRAIDRSGLVSERSIAIERVP